MKRDVLLAGVGGQGILSIAAVIARAAMRNNLEVKQSETHGMAQRGGSVLAHLRIADHPLHSDLIPRGCADLILGLEPLEAIRYLEYLAADGSVITDSQEVRNFESYPEAESLWEQIRSLPRVRVIDATALAREAGSPLAANMVLTGAASHYLPLSPEHMEDEIAAAFRHKGDRVVDTNLRAFRAGRESIPCPTP